MDKTQKKLTTLVASLGFTELEAQIYIFLLQNSPASGYKIAKLIRRSFTNTYKALESLTKKGAILPDQSNVSLYIAVGIKELLDKAEKDFNQTKEQLIKTVTQLPEKPDDKGIYHLVSVNQVYDKAVQLLNNCQERALIELFPGPFKKLSKELIKTSKRVKQICVRVYNKEEMDEVHLIHSPYGEKNLKEWNADWISIFIDGKQFLLAHMALKQEGVYDAIWSANPFLARAMYSYVNTDLHFYTLMNDLKNEQVFNKKNNLFNNAQELFPIGEDLGFKELQKYFVKK